MQLKDKVLLQLEYLKTAKQDLIPQINSISDYQISLMKPNVFAEGHPENCIRKMDLAFEELCTNLEEFGVHNPKQLTVFEFYSKIAYFKSKKKK